MKKQLKMFSILLTVAFSIFNIANIKLFPAANATYVEGPITQDTVWTLVDSPFVVSKDVIVYSNATLIIEPGVEVKFGGNFFLIISGRLYANGTGKTITFTSNRESPAAGDWGTIKFDGTNRSTLIGCFIAYAIDGIFVENGNVELESSTISFCQNGIAVSDGELMIENSTVNFCRQNGINIINSESTVQNSLIAENQENGISITGNGQIAIQKNTILANGNGLVLTGSEALGVNISQNKISANKQSGIHIDANNTDVTIINNIVSSNDKGFYISTPTSTYITNNSISYNNLGILYDQGNHTAHYNDVYGNQEMGMDVASDATVNAEYNYWGDRSGPYHETLNPNGKGDHVGGDGVNLDFIFFLTKPIGEINKRPTANLLTDKIWVPPNEIVMFFATNSSDDGRIDRYFFDFGDGSNSGWTTLSVFTHKYSLLGPYYPNLIVMDDYGAISNRVNTTLYVRNLQPLQVSIELSDSIVQEGQQVSMVVYVTNGTAAVENATVTMYSVKGGTFTQPSGLTNASGYFTTTFTTPDVTEIANVRIIARASKNGIGYADGSDHEYLQVLPFLLVQINAPNEIKSEEKAQIIVNVKSNEQTVLNASVTVSSDGGNLYPQTGRTDSNGSFLFVFTAPQTTEVLNIAIRAIATKSGYIDGAEQTTITIQPKVLAVQIVAESDVTISDAKLNVTVHVKYETNPIAEANVTITAENGNFSTTTGLTDINGNVTFVFTAPAVNKQSNINIMARATKDGYAQNQSQLQITVNPRTFNVEITAPTVNSEESATVMVHVTCKEDATSVSDATVSISASDGSFSDTTEVTDSNGHCTFIFNAPKTTTQLSVIITANVTKNGYTDGGNQTTITVNPKAIAEGGWPIMTILLIIIPIAIVVIVVVLVKLKIIGVSVEEEE